MTLKEFFIKVGIQLDAAQFSKVDTLIGGITKGVAALATAGAAAGVALGALAMSAANDAASIEKLAALMGVSTDTAQELAFAARRSGVDVKDMGELMSELAENLGEAEGGSGEAADAFKSLGLKVKDAKGKVKEADVALGEIADKFQTMPDGQKKTAALMGLFGEQGIALLPILNKGSAGIAELREEARALGIVIEGENIKQGAELTRQWEDFTAIAESTKQAIAGPLIASLLDVAKAFKEWWKINQFLVKQRLDKVVRALSFFVKPLVVAVLGLSKVVGFLIDNFEALAAIMTGALLAALVLNVGGIATLTYGYIAAGAAALWAGLKAAAAWVLASLPLIGIAVLFALIILLAQDIYGWLTGQDSLIGALWEKYKGFIKDWLQPTEEDGYLMRGLKWVLNALIELAEEWDYFVLFIEQTWDAVVQWMSDVFWGLIDSVKEGAKSVLDYIPGVDFEPGASAGDVTKQLEGINAQILGAFGAGATPRAGAERTAMKPTINPSFKAEIKVDGSKDPEETAKQVVKEAGAFWDREMRHLAEGV